METTPGTNKKALEQVRKLWWAAHLTACAARSKQAGLKALAAKQLGSRLRCVGVVPADKVRKHVTWFQLMVPLTFL